MVSGTQVVLPYIRLKPSAMKTEKEKMLAGELYDALDPVLSEDRRRARRAMQAFNATVNDNDADREPALRKMIPHAGPDLWIEPPFYCDYGYNIKAGQRVFFNFNCVVLDVNLVEIGDRVLFGPAVQIYTATHPLDWQLRAAGQENGLPVKIGSDVWVGGGAIINPGVTIGDRAVIGSGSVVTKDIPSDVFAAGNPCRVIRQLAPGEARPPEA